MPRALKLIKCSNDPSSKEFSANSIWDRFRLDAKFIGFEDTGMSLNDALSSKPCFVVFSVRDRVVLMVLCLRLHTTGNSF